LGWGSVFGQEKKREEFTRVVPVPSRLFWDIMERYSRRMPHRESLLFDISDRQARNIVYKFSLRYLRMKFRPHAIRHSYALFILKTTRDLEVVGRLLGHSDYKWLRVYLNYTQEDLAEELARSFLSPCHQKPYLISICILLIEHSYYSSLVHNSYSIA